MLNINDLSTYDFYVSAFIMSDHGIEEPKEAAVAAHYFAEYMLKFRSGLFMKEGTERVKKFFEDPDDWMSKYEEKIRKVSKMKQLFENVREGMMSRGVPQREAEEEASEISQMDERKKFPYSLEDIPPEDIPNFREKDQVRSVVKEESDKKNYIEHEGRKIEIVKKDPDQRVRIRYTMPKSFKEHGIPHTVRYVGYWNQGQLNSYSKKLNNDQIHEDFKVLDCYRNSYKIDVHENRHLPPKIEWIGGRFFKVIKAMDPELAAPSR